MKFSKVFQYLPLVYQFIALIETGTGSFAVSVKGKHKIISIADAPAS